MGGVGSKDAFVQSTWPSELNLLPVDLRGLNGLSEHVVLCMVFIMPCFFSVLWVSVGDLTHKSCLNLFHSRNSDV